MMVAVTTPTEGIEQFFSLAKHTYPAAFIDEGDNEWQLVEAFPHSGCNPAFEFDLILQQHDLRQGWMYHHWTCRVDISEISMTNPRQ